LGSGLGLYVTEKLIEKMGGKIWYESYIGKGTRFGFLLKAKASFAKLSQETH